MVDSSTNKIISSRRVRFQDEVTIYVLPQERSELTRRELLKAWWSTNQLRAILKQSFLELDKIMNNEGEKKSKNDNVTTNIEVNSIFSVGSKSQRSSSNLKTETATVRGLENLYQDPKRIKRQDEAIQCVLMWQKESCQSLAEEYKRRYKKSCKKAMKRALKYGKLDEYAIQEYLKTTTMEYQLEKEEQNGKCCIDDSSSVATTKTFGSSSTSTTIRSWTSGWSLGSMMNESIINSNSNKKKSSTSSFLVKQLLQVGHQEKLEKKRYQHRLMQHKQHSTSPKPLSKTSTLVSRYENMSMKLP